MLRIFFCPTVVCSHNNSYHVSSFLNALKSLTMKKKTTNLDAFLDKNKAEVLRPAQQKQVKGGDDGGNNFVVIDDLDGF